MEVCICYQEKRKLKWFRYFINNKKQKILVQIVFLIAYFQSFFIGFEKIYNEMNEDNNEPENIMLPLFGSFVVYTFSSVLVGYWIFIFMKWVEKKQKMFL